jgi:hypothetical protein
MHDVRRRAVVPGTDCAGMALRHHVRVPTLRIAQDDDADELLGRDPLAFLLACSSTSTCVDEAVEHSQRRLLTSPAR